MTTSPEIRSASSTGTVLAVSDALEKNRAGLFVGLRDPRLVLGAHYAQRWDVIEAADTTRDLEPLETNRTGRVVSLHTTVKPLAYLGSPAIVLRA